jgi:hypothetical protein
MPLKFFTRKRPQPDSRAVPIVLGVTGHRDVRDTDLPRLRQAVATIFEAFARHYRPTPLVLLSSLAQGAAQLCAEVALEKGLQVVAPLSFPATVYRQSSSFDNDEARHQFDMLLLDPRVTSFVAPLPEAEIPIDAAGWAGLLETPDTRRRCYANAGGYVVPLSCPDGPVGRRESDTPAPARPRWSSSSALADRRRRTHGRSHCFTGPTAARCTSCTPRIAATPAAQARRWQPHSLIPPLPSQKPHGALGQPTANQQKHEKQQFEDMCRSINRFNRRLRRSPQPSAQDVVARLLGEDMPPPPDDLSRLAAREAAALSRPLGQGAPAHRRRVWADLAGGVGLHPAHPFRDSRGPHLHTPPYPGLHRSDVWDFSIVIVVWFRHLSARRWTTAPRLRHSGCRFTGWRQALTKSVATSYLQQARSEMSWIRQAVRACTPGLHACCDAFARLSANQQIAWLRTVASTGLQASRIIITGSMHKPPQIPKCHYSLILAVLSWLTGSALVVGDLRLEENNRMPAADTQSATQSAQSQTHPSR